MVADHLEERPDVWVERRAVVRKQPASNCEGRDHCVPHHPSGLSRHLSRLNLENRRNAYRGILEVRVILLDIHLEMDIFLRLHEDTLYKTQDTLRASRKGRVSAYTGRVNDTLWRAGCPGTVQNEKRLTEG